MCHVPPNVTSALWMEDADDISVHANGLRGKRLFHVHVLKFTILSVCRSKKMIQMKSVYVLGTCTVQLFSSPPLLFLITI